MSGIVSGQCTCGRVQLSISPPFEELHLCHCSQCRRSNGSAFNLSLILSADQLRLDAGNAVREFESSPGKLRAFCGECGSPLYSRRENLPDVYRLRAGLFPHLPRPYRLTEGYRESGWPWVGDLVDLIQSDERTKI